MALKRREFMEQSRDLTDAELVAACLEGDREAFARIVERYQRLLCSLAYAASGSLSDSEDLAQEAFVTAWQQLGKLREPDKLRSWLCGIMRNTMHRSHRKSLRNPVHQANELTDEALSARDDACVAGDTMKREEERLLWRAIEEIPPDYREPLVLFYREERSVRAVATALELTESAVKQRLTRGRRLLRQRMLSFVEEGLRKSAPGPVFTAGVIAAIATLGTPAKAAAAGTAGATATKAGMSVKTISLAAFMASISGLVSTVFAVRANLDQSGTAKERRNAILTAVALLGSFGLIVLLVLGMKGWALGSAGRQHFILLLAQAAILVFTVGWSFLLWSLLRRTRELRRSERMLRPDAFRGEAHQVGSKASEFRTKRTFLGIPLIHFRLCTAEYGSPPIVAWIAGGDRAIGILFAWGAFSIGIFSIGAFSIGVFSLGAVSFGLFSIGSIGFGAFVLGAMAYGYVALGSLSAVGWQSAQGGGFVAARWFAEGPVAWAAHANDSVAREFFSNQHADATLVVLLLVATILTIVPAALYARAVRKRFGKRSEQSR
jgi:RNA polymerase sigma factor (sigma-70 family)